MQSSCGVRFGGLRVLLLGGISQGTRVPITTSLTSSHPSSSCSPYISHTNSQQKCCTVAYFSVLTIRQWGCWHVAPGFLAHSLHGCVGSTFSVMGCLVSVFLTSRGLLVAWAWGTFQSAPGLWSGCGSAPLPPSLYTIHVDPLAYNWHTHLCTSIHSITCLPPYNVTFGFSDNH